MSDGTPTLRETLEAAAAPREVSEPVVVAVAPEPVIAPEAPAGDPLEPVLAAEPTPGQDSKAAGATNRDDQGRFLPKEPKAPEAQAAPVAEAKPETATPAEPGAQDEPTRIPPSLSAAVKAQWSELPKEVREDISKLEGSVQTAKAEWQAKGQRLNRFDEIIGPHLDHWRLNGLDEFSGVQTLLAAQAILERNPVQGLVHIARSYGVNPSQIAEALGLQQSAPQPGAEGQQAPTAQPDLTAALQPYLARVQTLEQQLQAVTQGTEAEKLASARAEVDEFKSKPEHMYFENVKADVSRRLESGAATTLADAYEQAIWASSEVRPLLIKAQGADQARKDREAADRLKATNARQAAGSVTGSPSPGSQGQARGSLGSLRADLEAARDSVSAQI